MYFLEILIHLLWIAKQEIKFPGVFLVGYIKIDEFYLIAEAREYKCPLLVKTAILINFKLL